MMGRKKLAGALACVAAIAGMAVGASSAAAFNAPVGSTVHGMLVSPAFSLGSPSFISCTGLLVTGQITANPGLGSGGQINLTYAGTSGCSPGSITIAVPRTLSMASNGSSTIAGATLNVVWGSLSCTYNGTITGAFSSATSELVLGGSLVRTAGASLCPTPAPVTGTLELWVANGHLPLQL